MCQKECCCLQEREGPSPGITQTDFFPGTIMTLLMTHIHVSTHFKAFQAWKSSYFCKKINGIYFQVQKYWYRIKNNRAQKAKEDKRLGKRKRKMSQLKFPKEAEVIFKEKRCLLSRRQQRATPKKQGETLVQEFPNLNDLRMWFVTGNIQIKCMLGGDGPHL